MDEERVEALGAEPLTRRSGAGRHRELADEAGAGRPDSCSVGDSRASLASSSTIDPGNPERYLVFLEQGGISLPNENYYREEQFASVREAYVVHIQRMLELAGLDDAPARAKRVFDLETEIARRHWDNVTTRDSEKTYNPMEWTSVRNLFIAGVPTGSGEVSLDQWPALWGSGPCL